MNYSGKITLEQISKLDREWRKNYMSDLTTSAHEFVKIQEEAEQKQQMISIKRQISKALKEMDIADLALTNKLIIHRKQVQRYFELHKLLGRQIG